MTQPNEARHLTRESLARYLEQGYAVTLKIDGDPPTSLLIDPKKPRIALRTPWDGGALPDLNRYEHVSLRVVAGDHGSLAELSIEGSDNLEDAHGFMMSVADRYQLEHRSFLDATRLSLDAHAELIDVKTGLSDDQEVGLFGELILLRHLIGEVGESKSLNAWRGPFREEHDFGMETYDVEVKTTYSEERKHWIESLKQLMPTTDRRLWLASVQLTLAGDGGLRLPDLVAQIRDLIHLPLEKARFDELLERNHWDDVRAALLTRRFRLRSSPAWFPVENDFPRLTPSFLTAGGLDIDRFVETKYRIRIDGIEPESAPKPFQEIRED